MRIKVGLGVAGTDNDAAFELKGSREWIVAVLPQLAFVVGGMVRAAGADSEKMAAVYNELVASSNELLEGRAFAGAFVSTTLATEELTDDRR